MKKILLALAAIPAVMLASDASAQPGYGARGDMGIGVQLDNLDARLDAGVQAGAISSGEQRRLRYQMRDLRQLEERYARNGIDRQERATLQQRLIALRQDVRRAGGSNWGNRYGWDDNDWNGRGDGNYGQRDGNYGRGGGYGGYGRGLRVGDSIPRELHGSLYSATRLGYRDRGNIQFRSDGRQVYEINVRTNRIVRINPIR